MARDAYTLAAAVAGAPDLAALAGRLDHPPEPAAATAIVPEPTVLQDAKALRVCLRRFADQKLSRPLGVLVRKVRREDRAVRAFLQHLGIS